MSSSASTAQAVAAPARGKILALVGILLTAVNLRIAITSLSVLYSDISKDVSGFNVSIIAILPLICFAVFGFLAPRLSKVLGLEKSLAVAMALVVVGEVLRAFSSDVWVFAVCTIIAGAGMAFGNVLVPPTIKTYFPNNTGGMTAAYSIVLSVSAAIPSLLAEPIAQMFDWRVSIGWWGVLALIALVPWLILRRSTPKDGSAPAPVDVKAASDAKEDHVKVWKWPVAWALVFMLGFGFLSMYSMTNYLSSYLAPQGGGHDYFSVSTVGDILFAYNLAGLVHSLVVPLVIGKMKHPYFLIALAGVLEIVGYLGFLYLPKLSWVWAFEAAPGLLICIASFQLINLRTRTAEGAAQLSGFVQGIGYVFACLGPLFVGLLHTWTSGWTAPFWFLIVASVVMMIVTIPSVRNEYLEDAKPKGRSSRRSTSSVGSDDKRAVGTPLAH